MSNRGWLIGYLLVLCVIICYVVQSKTSPKTQVVYGEVDSSWPTIYRDTSKNTVIVTALKQGNWGETEVTGTGIYLGDGLVLTCHHVVDRGRVVKVDGSPSIILKMSSQQDMALLKTPLSGPGLSSWVLTPVIGQEVMVIGNPFTYSKTVTTGVVSGVDRCIDMPAGETLRGLIQVSACINPGASGGPVVNRKGELIGMVVALREGSQGIGFVIPVSHIQEFLRGDK